MKKTPLAEEALPKPPSLPKHRTLRQKAGMPAYWGKIEKMDKKLLALTQISQAT